MNQARSLVQNTRMKTQLKITFSVKVSQGNSLEMNEIFSHMLFSNLTKTLQVSFLRELSSQFHLPCPVLGGFFWQED